MKCSRWAATALLAGTTLLGIGCSNCDCINAEPCETDLSARSAQCKPEEDDVIDGITPCLGCEPKEFLTGFNGDCVDGDDHTKECEDPNGCPACRCVPITLSTGVSCDANFPDCNLACTYGIRPA